jgi:hypothetical protein
MIEVYLNNLLYSHLYSCFWKHFTEFGQCSDYTWGSMAKMDQLDPLRACSGGEIAINQVLQKENY